MADPVLRFPRARQLLKAAEQEAYSKGFHSTRKVRVKAPSGEGSIPVPYNQRVAERKGLKFARIAHQKQRGKLLRGQEFREARMMREEDDDRFAPMPLAARLKMIDDETRNNPVPEPSPTSPSTVPKSKVVTIKPKTDKKRKAFDPKLLFKKRR